MSPTRSHAPSSAQVVYRRVPSPRRSLSYWAVGADRVSGSERCAARDEPVAIDLTRGGVETAEGRQVGEVAVVDASDEGEGVGGEGVGGEVVTDHEVPLDLLDLGDTPAGNQSWKLCAS